MRSNFKKRKSLVVSRKWFKLLTIIILLPFSLSPFLPLSYGYTFLGTTPPGDPVRGHSAKTSGMGNITAACIKDEPNLYFNPASLMFATNKHVSLSLYYIPAEEKTIVEYQPPELNFQNYVLGSLSIVLPLKEWVIGFGIYPLYDMQYKSEQKTYSVSVLTSHTKAENTGTLYSYTLSGAHKFGLFSFGVSINFLTTDYETKIDKYDLLTGKHSSIIFRKDYLRGTNCTVSTMIDLTENVLVGASYIPETELERKEGKRLKLPSQYTLSTTLNIEQSVFAFEIIFTENKKAEFRLGAEHLTEVVDSAVPIRYGVGFVPHPADNKHYAFSISAGSGVKLSENVLLDFAGSYENTNITSTLGNITGYIQQNSYKLICSTKFTF